MIRFCSILTFLLLCAPISNAMGEREAAKTMPPEPDIFKSAKPFERDTLHIQKQSGGDPIRFDIELAITPQQQMLGMMNRTEMDDNEGMLFVFPDVKMRSFWMKNTLIPLDIIFLDGTGVIKHIHPMATPKDLTPIPSIYPARVALEIKGGTAKTLDLKVGDQMIYSKSVK